MSLAPDFVRGRLLVVRGVLLSFLPALAVARNCDGEEGVMGCLHFWQLLFRYFSSAYQLVYLEE